MGELATDVLSDAESVAVLTEVILPAWTRHAVRQPRPVVILVAGPPGSGKTILGDLVQAVLDARGGSVRIGADLYKAAHRAYETALANNVRTAGVSVRHDTRRWQAAVEEHVRTHGLDAVVETALADPEEARVQALAYRAAGFRVEVVALACSLAWSQLGVLDRYLGGSGPEGTARYVSWENHDRCARQLGATLGVLESERLVDRVSVVRRGMELLYANELTDGRWTHRPGAADAVEVERARWWSAVETATFRRSLAGCGRALVRAETRMPADHLLAVERDVERCAALAEPVRRIAQPRAQAPGVDYHRLSPDQHRWIFEHLIVPGHLAAAVPQERPAVVYVVGEPGAGVTRAAWMVGRATRPGTVHLAWEDVATAHPDYYQLLVTDPRGDGTAIREDCRAWWRQAEAYVRDRRGDLVIEASPASSGELLDSAAAFHRAGYRVELVVLAAREADSRQATAERYARAQHRGVHVPFPSPAAHRAAFTAVADVVLAAQDHPAIDTVMVIDRDGRALARQTHQHQDGMRPAGALATARLRPYSDGEATRFLAANAALRLRLPEYRAELRQIAMAARSLMPPRFQPTRLEQPLVSTAQLLPAALYRPRSSFSSAA